MAASVHHTAGIVALHDCVGQHTRCWLTAQSLLNKPEWLLSVVHFAVGPQISEGSGRILVVATGTQSEWGKTMALVGGAGSEDTPLQEKLADLAAAIGKIGFGVAVACFIALLIKW